jgi:hypothetical protein
MHTESDFWTGAFLGHISLSFIRFSIRPNKYGVGSFVTAMDRYEFENLDSILGRLALEAIDIPIQRGLEAHFPDAVCPKGETKHSLPSDEEG